MMREGIGKVGAMKLIHIAVALAIMVVICTPIVLGSTNSHTETRTTTAQLSNSAAYSGFSIHSDQLNLGPGYGKYASGPFTAVNLTSGHVQPYSVGSTDTVYDYAWLYSNTLWINSTDARHNTGGHAHYSIRYPFNSIDSGYVRDFWYTNDLVGSSHDAVYGGGAIVTPAGKPYQNYIDFDGNEDYTRTNFAYDYDSGWWYMAAMLKGDGTMGVPIGISDAGSNGIIMLQYTDAATDYYELFVRDQNMNQASITSGAIVPNQWYFVVLQADGTHVHLWVNGVKQGSIDLTYNADSQLNFDYIQLGSIYYEGGNIIDWAGCMDEFRFHAGWLPNSECSNTGLMGTYMWDCVDGDTPPKASGYLYNLAGAGDGNLRTLINTWTTGDAYLTQYSMTWLNTEPNSRARSTKTRIETLKTLHLTYK